ncbi:hypothetical protein MTR67_008029 [Solanum verrucosum]|uniref:Tetratricopeptide repeat protein 5 OB fold domain-containing protein n=1 Tax=Solanum verrucosum TaxID=315347 RepID=A0AAF0Q770_SOLVR|nr:hypothetical protein MTR67_008029 [Solanum verrucosum]
MAKGESSTNQKADWIENVEAKVQWLYDYWQTHFPGTKEDKMLDMEYAISTCVVDIYAIIPEENLQSNYERAVFEYLRGSAHNAIPGVYSKKAEDHLKNATKFNPDLLVAWNALGDCVAKKGDYSTARNCFLFVLGKKEDARTLRHLAYLELMCARGELEPYVPEDLEHDKPFTVPEDPQHHIEECIKYAEKAIKLKDAEGCRCYYELGSAYLTSFILDGRWNDHAILMSLEAFEKAERIDTIKSEPDFQCECGLANRLLENYEKSLIRLSDAVEKDPAHDASHQVEITVQLLDKLEELVQGKSNENRKGKSKAKSKGKGKRKSKGKSTETSFASLIQSLDDIDLDPSYNKATLDVLAEGPNKGLAVMGVVRCLVKYEYGVPLYYVLCDSDGNSFVLLVFGIQEEAIKQGDQVTLLEPFCKFVDFKWKEKHYQF